MRFIVTAWCVSLLFVSVATATPTIPRNDNDENNHSRHHNDGSPQPWHQKCKSFLQQVEQHRKNVEQGLVDAIQGLLSKFDKTRNASSSRSSSRRRRRHHQKVSDRPWRNEQLQQEDDDDEKVFSKKRQERHSSSRLPIETTTTTTSTSKTRKAVNDWSWIMPRRMSRACRSRRQNRHHHHHHHTFPHVAATPPDDDNVADPMLVSVPTSASVSQQPAVSLLWQHDEEEQGDYNYRSSSVEEPFIGMELQVYHEEQCFPLVVDNAAKVEVDPMMVMHQQQQLQHFTCVGDDVMELPTSYSDSYVLIEPMHLQLGVVPKHTLDYAYKPVVAVSVTTQQQPTTLRRRDQPHQEDTRFPSPMHPPATKATPQEEDSEFSKSNDNDDDDGRVDDDDNINNRIYANDTTVVGGTGPAFEASGWWRWWFPFSNSWWRDSSHEDGGYDRSGNSAFAGGSHGEVWKGRRKCHISRRERGNACCDDQQVLVLKRLKVEQGYRLLEAGLREVYFGNMLTNQLKDDQGLFTVYVDHFFREIIRPSFATGRPPTKDLELWIVFEDAGPSLRSYLYSAVTTGDFVVFQQSALWYTLRMGSRGRSVNNEGKSVAIVSEEHRRNRTVPKVVTSGRELMREVLRQILTSAAFLHEHGIVHRDIKPSNVMCRADVDPTKNRALNNLNISSIHCILGDFSSAWNNFTAQSLYTNGPSQAEQTDEYAPPEALFGPAWVPFHEHKPQSYDSWSIGVLALELMLGTPNVFSVDQRTTVLLSTKMRKAGASADELQRALYLAALSQFCIYMPAVNASKNGNWPMRRGEPLHNISMAKQSCTLHDFHRALRARDPLGVGFDSSADSLLRLIWQLLAWNPMDRITAAEALKHPFFTDSPLDTSIDLVAGSHNALESQMLDPRLDFNLSDTVSEFVCPKCGRKFGDWRSCQKHATTRRHAQFCEYDRSALPTCLNAHVMLPAHPKSGYCDIQGRRRVIEDFHAIHLHPSHQFYGVFDGHTGNLASKFAASSFYEHLAKRLSGVDEEARTDSRWKRHVLGNLTESFAQVHDSFLKAVALAPHGVMDQSGTTATTVFVTNTTVVIASIGDSRAVASSRSEAGQMRAIQLTVDHVASNEDEKRMVEERGGQVIVFGGMSRVNGTLAITRSIGDADFAPILSRSPHVVALLKSEINELCGMAQSDLAPCFIVLATDGLWDVISNEEAVNMVSQVVVSYDTEANGLSWEEGGGFQKAAELLTQEAYVRGSTDNIGVCVIAID